MVDLPVMWILKQGLPSAIPPDDKNTVREKQINRREWFIIFFWSTSHFAQDDGIPSHK